jgi:hypothetical protein
VEPFRKFSAILRNPKVHHRVHKSPPLVPILRQFDPIHTIPSYLSKVKKKGKVVPVLNLIKHYAMKAYGGVDV